MDELNIYTRAEQIFKYFTTLEAEGEVGGGGGGGGSGWWWKPVVSA